MPKNRKSVLNNFFHNIWYLRSFRSMAFKGVLEKIQVTRKINYI